MCFGEYHAPFMSLFSRQSRPACFRNLPSQGWFSKPLIMLVLPLWTFSNLSVSFKMPCPGKNSALQLNPNQYGLNLPVSHGYVKILNITYWNSCAEVTLIWKIINVGNLNLAFRTIQLGISHKTYMIVHNSIKNSELLGSNPQFEWQRWHCQSGCAS